jgi:hypothetical protein
MDASSDWVVSGGAGALDFDGSNDWVNVNDNTSLDIASGGSLTISAWIYRTANVAAYETIVTKRLSDGQTTNYEFSLNNSSTGNSKALIFYSGGSFTLSTTLVSLSAWTHVSTVTNASGTTYYVNGLSAGTSVTLVGSPNNHPFKIGGVAGSPETQFLNAALDDIRIYNRALSATEISLLSKERGIGFKTNSRSSSVFAKRYSYKPPKDKTYAAITRSQSDYDSLREGLVLAICPSVSGATGYRAVDVSGRGNHGTLTNMTPEDWVSSNGVALDFDGSDDFVDNNPWTTNIGTGNFSVSAWVKTSSATRQAILAAYDGDSPDQGMIFDILNTGKVRCSAIGPNSATNLIFSDGNTSVDTGAWVHVCGVRTSSAMAIYEHGKLDTASTTSLGNPNVSITGSHRIGLTRSDAGYSAPFNGQIDDVRVYTRALTPPEIRLLASKRGIGLQPRPKQFTFYQFPSGSKRRRILTGMT